MKNQTLLSSWLAPEKRARLLAALVGLAALLCPLDSRAASITFNPPATCAGDSDVFNVGGGYAYSWSTAQTVNGVTFTPLTGTVGGGNLSLSGFNAVNPSALTTTAAPFANLSPAYRGVLVGFVAYNVANAGLGTVSLDNLLPGGKYVVQVWAGDPRTGATTNRAEWIYDGFGGATNLLAFNTTRTNGGLGQFITGKFTADGSSQTFVLDSTTAPVTNFLVQMNAISLRDVTAVWSGTTSGNWADSDNSSANFTGLSFQGIKTIGETNVFFGDKDGSGSSAPATTTIAIGVGGVSGVSANFQNNTLAYTVSCADATGITGARSVTLSGTNTVTFTGAHTYTGSTVLKAGAQLILGASGSIGGSTLIDMTAGSVLDAAASSFTIGSATTLRGSGTLKGNVTANAGAGVQLGASAGVAGSLVISNNLTLNGQALTFDLGAAAAADTLTVGGVLTMNSNSVITLNKLSPIQVNGTYTLMTFASKAGAGTFALDTIYPGITLNNNPTSVTLTVTGGLAGSVGTWTNLAGGSWTNSANWLGGVIATNVDNIADFSTLDITAARTVTVNRPSLTIGHMVFGDLAQDNNWTLSTGTNVLAVSSGSPSIIVGSGQNTTISATLQGNQGLTKLGAGTLTLSGANRLTNGVQVNGGTLIVSGAGPLGGTVVSTLNPVTVSNATLSFATGTPYTNNLAFAGTSNNLVVGGAANTTVTWIGSITGSNTVALSVPNSYGFTQRGDMTNFNGTFIINGVGNGAFFMAQNDEATFVTGSSNAVFEFNGGTRHYLMNNNNSGTCYMGELRGTGGSLWTKYRRSGLVILEVGALNTSSTFGGIIYDWNNDTGLGTPYPSFTGLRKIGNGHLTLSGGTHAFSGPTTVVAGILQIDGNMAGNRLDGSPSGSPVTVQNGAKFILNGQTGTNTVMVQSGGLFELNGSLGSGACTVQSGGRITCGASASWGTGLVTVDGVADVTAAGVFNLNSASLAGSGVITGAVAMSSSTVNPGPVGGAGTLTITNGNFTASGGTLVFDLSNTPGSGNDQLVVNGDLDFSSPGVTVSINKIAGTLGSGTYVLAKCTGSLLGSAGNLTLTGANPLDALQFNGNQLELVVSAVPNLTWTGDGSGNLWDIGTSTTWLNGAVPSTFANGNTVTFNSTGASNPVVNVPASVAPAAVTVTGSSNYVFTGAGDITGGTALIKNGGGTLTVLNTNTFTGKVFLNGGTLRLGDGVTNGALSAEITNSAALIIANGQDQTLTNVISGPGTVTKQSAGTLFVTSDNTITGPTVISAGVLSLGDGIAAGGSLGTGIVTNNTTLAINRTGVATISSVVRNQGGMVNLGTGPVTLAAAISGSGSLTNDVVGTLLLTTSNSYSGGTFIKQGIVQLHNFNGLGIGPVVIDDVGGGSLNFYPANNSTNVVANNIVLPNATTTQFSFDSQPSFPATVRLTGVISGGAAGQATRFVMNPQSNNNRPVVRLENPANTFTTIPEIRRGTLAFTSDGALGNATNGIRSNCEIGITGGGDITIQGLRFDADNITLNSNRQIELVNSAEFINVQSFTGTIAGPVVGTGSLRKLGSGTLRLTGEGSLTGQTSISNGTLRVDSPIWTGTSLAAAAGTTLMGTGTITAPVTISSGATLSPGASIGTLTVSNTLTLAAGSTSVMEINATSATGDSVAGIGTLNYGGTLTVNLSGSPSAGQNYQLFSASNYVGNFAATNLPALGGGLNWNWTPANGTLSVVGSVATNPTNIVASVTGGNTLNLSWPADHTGWRLEVQTNSLSVGIATNWSTWPGSAATNAVSVPIDPANPTVFYRLVYP